MNIDELKLLFEFHVPLAANHVGSHLAGLQVSTWIDERSTLHATWYAYDANGPQFVAPTTTGEVAVRPNNIGANHIFSKDVTPDGVITDIETTVMFYCLIFRQREGSFIMGAMSAYDFLTKKDFEEKNPAALLDAVYRMYAVMGYNEAIAHNKIDTKAKENMMGYLEHYHAALWRRNMGTLMVMLATRAANNATIQKAKLQ